MSADEDLPLPDLSRYTALKDDDDRNTAAMFACKHYNNEAEKITIWIKEQFRELVWRRCENRFPFTEKECTPTPFRILGVASGDGVIESHVISELREVVPGLMEVTVVEPSRKAITAYQSLVQENERFGDVTWYWCRETLQDFVAERGKDQKFDFICLLHAMYFSPLVELRHHLSAIYELLAEGGVLFSVHDMGDNLLAKVEAKFSEVIHPLRPGINTDHIRQTLDEMGVEYNVIGAISATTDITTLFETVQESDETQLMLDAILQVVGFVEKASPEEVRAVLHWLKRSDVSVTRNGRVYTPNSAEALLVFKK